MGLRTDLNLAPLPVTIPNVGGLLGKNAIVIDPDFGTEIMRLTDGGDSKALSMQTADTSSALIWNADDTLIFARNTGHASKLYQFNPSTMQGQLLPYSTTATVCFSFVSPGVFYSINGSVVSKTTFTLVGGVWTFQSVSTVCDFATILPAGFNIKWNSVFKVSIDDTTFSAAFSQGAQNSGYLACVYQTGHGAGGFRMANTQTGQITGDWGPTGAIVLTSTNAAFPFTLHEMSQPPNPAYSVIGPHGPGLNGKALDTTIIWEIASLNFVDENVGGHKAQGYLHAYTGDAGGGQLSEIPYVNPVQPYRHVVPDGGLPPNFYGDRHFSFGRIALDDSSIVWSSTGANTKLPYNAAWEGEVFGYDIVSGTVYRACHLFNTFKSREFIVANTMAVPSRTGNFVAFTSDWMGSLGSTSGGQTGIPGVNARGDVFIVRVSTAVALGSSSTGLVTSENPATQGDTVTFTVTVGTLGPNPPTGTVTLYDGSTVIASDILGTDPNGNQVVSFDISTLATGSHSIKAVYAGDTNNTPSTSPVLIETVAAVTPVIPAIPTDAFDLYLNKFATVLTRSTQGGDGYGQADPTFTPVDVGVPCRVSVAMAGTDIELRAKSKEDIAFRKVYIRPWFLDASPDGSYVPNHAVGGVTYNTQPLTHDHWLQIDSQMYDIAEEPRNPGGLNHHLELVCRIVEV